MGECDERASERVGRGERKRRKLVSEGESAREREEEEGKYERNPAPYWLPVVSRHARMPASRPAGRSVRPPASDAVSRFAPIVPKNDATHSLIDRMLF